jgi:hypothetical protein
MSSYILSVRDVVELYSVPERTVRHWAHTEVLRGWKEGRAWCFDSNIVKTSMPRLRRRLVPEEHND